MPLAEPAGAIAAQLGELCILIGFDEAVVVGPGPAPEARELPSDPDAIREHVRYDAEGRHRPLSGLRNLPPNWHARFTTLEAMAAALDAVYPLAQRHLAQRESGTLEVVSLEDVIQRQQGRYALAAGLSPRGRDLARRALCGSCVRVPFWAGEQALADGAIPCPEPCSVMLSLCREAAVWERDRPVAVPPDPAIPFAAFEEPGNPLREAFLRTLEPRQ